jgi:quinol monooxygenase YgiN
MCNLMREYVLAISILMTLGSAGASAQDRAVTVVSYIDVSSTNVAATKALLSGYRGTCAREDGNGGVKVLQEMGRPDRFAVVEVWSDKEAVDRHMTAKSTLALREALKLLQVAPPDDRVGTALVPGKIPSESPADAVYVLTHVDIAPERSAESQRILNEAAAASRRDEGNLTYEIIQQTDRSNHFTFVEVWSDTTSLQAHAAAPHTIAFRSELRPIEGALYDERLYGELR